MAFAKSAGIHRASRPANKINGYNQYETFERSESRVTVK